MKVQKRDGREVKFQPSKVKRAIEKACTSVNITDKQVINSLTEKALAKFPTSKVVSVEEIQDVIENVLLEHEPRVGKAFMLWRQKRSEARCLAASLGVTNDLKLSNEALYLLKERYLLKDKDGNVIESPSQMFRRVAKAMANVESYYGKSKQEVKKIEQEFFKMMVNKDFCPNSPCLFNAGTELSQLSACFAFQIDDSITSIFNILSKCAKTFKSGGGCGLNFSKLRPRDDVVQGTQGTASGPLSFMNIFNEMCETIKQGCLIPSTIVRSDKGLVTLNSFKNCRQSKVDDGNGYVPAVLSAFNPKGKTVKIQNELGLEVEGTPDHLVRVLDKEAKLVWKSLEDLTCDDYTIVVKGNHKGVEQKLPTIFDVVEGKEVRVLPEYLNENLAWLIGLYITKGYIIDGQFCIELLDIEEQHELREKLRCVLNALEIRYSVSGNRDKTRVWFNFTSRNLCEYLENIGCNRLNKLNTRIPKVILNSKPDTCYAFLKGVFDGAGNYENCLPTLTSYSMVFANEVHQLLLSLGIMSVKTVCNANEVDVEPYTRIAMYDEKNTKLFLEHIGFTSTSNRTYFDRICTTKDYEKESIPYLYPYICNHECFKGIDIYKAFSEEEHQYYYVYKNKLPTLLKWYPELKKDQALVELMNPNFHYSKVVCKTTGECETLDLESVTGQYVANGIIVHNSKRRGAMMGILDCSSPDILDFIVCKEREGKLSNFNLSVGLNKQFMDALKNDEDFNLVNPRTGKVTKKVKARALWNMLITLSWKNGEPGVLFFDNINKANPTPEVDTISLVNPCLHEDALIPTPNGYRKLRDITEGESIVTPVGVETVIAKETHLDYPTVKITFSDGAKQIVTQGHVYHVIRKGSSSKKISLVPVKDLQVGDFVRVEPVKVFSDTSKVEWDIGILTGILLGNGCYTDKETNGKQVKIIVNPEEKKYINSLKTLLIEEGVTGIIEDYESKCTSGNLVFINEHLMKKLRIRKACSYEKRIFPEYMNLNPMFYRGLINGLFSSNGNVNLNSNQPQLTFIVNSETLAQDIRNLLLIFNIHSEITSTFDKVNIAVNEEIRKKYTKFTVTVSGESVKCFIDEFKCLHPKKSKQLRNLAVEWLTTGNTRKAKVISIEPHVNCNVMDLKTVSDSWIAEGFVQQGCGEQPLLHNESCCLGSINLSNFILNSKNKKTVDYDRLKKTVCTAVRFLDNLLDANKYPFDEIAEASLANRKIGLGVMGWADLLILLGIPYNSNEALTLAEQVMKFIQEEGRQASRELGKEKGSFPNKDRSIYKNEPHMRNATVNTAAPTGCSVKTSYIMSDKGILTLEELGNVNGEKWQVMENLDVYQENNKVKATKFYVNGLADTKKITLHSGIVLESTPNHKYRVLTDNDYKWVECRDLKVGDCLAVKIGGYNKVTNAKLEVPEFNINDKRCKPITLPNEMTPDVAKFIGFMIGNGSQHKAGIKLHFNINAKEKMQYFTELIQRIFNWTPKISTRYKINSCEMYFTSVRLLQWLKLNGLEKGKSTMATVPMKVRESSKESLTAFIDGLFLADGNKHGTQLKIDTASKELANDLIICLRALGQNSRLYTYTNVKGRLSKKPSYRVSYVNNGSCTAEKMCIPEEEKDISVSARIVDGTIWYDKIVKIEDSQNETYDIEVPENNTYVSNSAISHNSISIITGCSQSIEPIFSIVAMRNVKETLGKNLVEINNAVIKLMKDKGLWNDSMLESLKEGGCLMLPKDIKKIAITANEVPPEWHVKMQASFQKYIDNACSKTVNLPNEATIDDVEKIYLLAYSLGCKGLTVYRDGSRGKQLLTTTRCVECEVPKQ